MTRPRPAPVPRVAWVLAAVVAVGLAFPILWHQVHADPANRLVDLAVYREAGHSVLSGRAVYEFRTPPPQLLPFTYPPFPAVLAAPLALLPFLVVGWAWELASLALLCWLVAFCFRPVVAKWSDRQATGHGARLAGWVTALVAPLLLPVLIWLEPVRTTFRFGQVNIIIAALVVADCALPRTRWPRGVLVGLAAAIKLTPALFIPYLWLSGRRRPAYVATATFFGCQLLAAAVIPRDSLDYWTGALFHSGRLGNNKVTANVAIRGALLRLHPPKPVFVALLLLVVGAAAWIGMSRALRASRGGAELAGVALVGLTSVAISPVSWDHHLIWLVPAFAVLLAEPTRRRLATAVGLAALFYTRAPWWGARMVARTGGLPELLWRLLNMSFTIVTLIAIVVLPLEPMSHLSRSSSRGGTPEE